MTEPCGRCHQPLAPLLSEKQIAGSLKAAIDAHGPITLANRNAAAKRIYGELKAVRRAEHDAGCPDLRYPPPSCETGAAFVRALERDAEKGSIARDD